MVVCSCLQGGRVWSWTLGKIQGLQARRFEGYKVPPCPTHRKNRSLGLPLRQNLIYFLFRQARVELAQLTLQRRSQGKTRCGSNTEYTIIHYNTLTCLPCRHKFLFTLFHIVMFALHRVLVIFKSSQHAVCPLWVPGSSMPSNPTASTALSPENFVAEWADALLWSKNIEILDSSLSQHAPNLGDSTTQKHVVLISACIDHMCVYTWPKHNNFTNPNHFTLLYTSPATCIHNISQHPTCAQDETDALYLEDKIWFQVPSLREDFALEQCTWSNELKRHSDSARERTAVSAPRCLSTQRLLEHVDKWA